MRTVIVRILLACCTQLLAKEFTTTASSNVIVDHLANRLVEHAFKAPPVLNTGLTNVTLATPASVAIPTLGVPISQTFTVPVSATSSVLETAAHVPAVAQCAGETGPKSALAVEDTEVFDILTDEYLRQREGIELIASENFASQAVLDALGSVMTNKYSEGQVGARYYGGNEHIDRVESLCKQRALKLFGLSPEEWAVNVQPYSGSPANFAVYTALLKPHDRIMGLDLPSGGHLTHGYFTEKKRVSATSIYFESLPYEVNAETGLIDYEELRRRALLFRPKLLIAGASAYPREWDYAAMRRIADEVGALLMTDMAHISGLVAGGQANSPFEYSHVVTSTTHKSLRGPRSGMIFSRKQFSEDIDFAVFPSLQGGPHNNVIAALAVAFKEADTENFRQYAKLVRENAKALAEALISRGQRLATGGTDNHLMLWDLRPEDMTGSKVDAVLELVHISANKNSIVGDKSAISPGGVRLGTPAMTTRGMRPEHCGLLADLLMRALKIAKTVQDKTGKKMAAFKEYLALAQLEGGDAAIKADLLSLRQEVKAFATQFPFPSRFNR